MKKILSVFDGYKLSKSTIDYAISFSRALNAHLVGVFLDETIYHSYPVAKVLKSGPRSSEILKQLDEKDKRKRDEAASRFQQACNKAGIPFSVHRDKNIALRDLKHESMFADLVIINKHETFTRFREEPPTRFIKDLLGDVQCPVLVVPAQFLEIDKILLLYDGRPSSLFAIRQYSYLFGGLTDYPVEVLTVKDHYMPNLHVPDNKLMREFIKRHFPKATFTVIKGDPEEEILQYLEGHRENELVVLGAYRRSEVSRWFKSSMADKLMQDTDTPLFIAHS
ncbi:MAG: universal stress protein [Ferruginibacter sp.]|jgi:nucleotide-binding universal stress UspA family protein